LTEQGAALRLSLPVSAPKLSIIIPTWNEERLIADAIAQARVIGDEVIVVDGGSRDGTAAWAEEAGAAVVTAPKGRGPQLLAGAAAAKGEILLFLHADARLPPSARDAILGALAEPAVLGGAFYIRFLPGSWFTRLLEPANSLRRRLSKRYYGDTGLFVRAPTYRELGGHRPWKVMHDYEFSGRMEKAGRCVYITEPCIWASARRFEGRELRTLGAWLTVQTLYRFGVPPRLLSPLYPDVRGTPEQDERFMALARNEMGPPEDGDR
jgi:rSAM/selenodomain-associated transferase 2